MIPSITGKPPLMKQEYISVEMSQKFQLKEGEYYGEILNGQPHGQGTLKYNIGGSYVGNFLHGQKHGQGHMTYGENYSYQGEWQYNQRNGEGTLQLGPLLLQGIFKDDALWEGKMTLIHPGVGGENPIYYQKGKRVNSQPFSNHCSMQ